MKINFLHVIIIATTFSSLHIHAMENEKKEDGQLLCNPQTGNNYSLVVSNSTYISNSNNNTVNGTTYNSITNPNLPTQNNNQRGSERKLTAGQADLYEVSLNVDTHLTPIQDSKNPQKTILFYAYGEDYDRPMKNIFEQEDNIRISCCKKNIVCTRCFLLTGIGGTLTLAGSIIVVALTMAGVIHI